MTSVMSSFSQIPVRTKYFLGLSGGESSASLASQNAAFTLTPGAFLDVTSMATDADISGAGLNFTPYVELSGNTFKDLGRQIVIYDPATAEHIAVFRQVQRINGSASEGVGVSFPTTPETYLANIYVKVWAADGSGVAVVRTG
jgi:hypothetical protein